MDTPYRDYVRFGTSSWAYEEWKGNVYFKDYDESNFKKDCLTEYAADRRFSTVGMDLFFYQPPTASLLTHYANQLPQGFKTCSKVWQELTIYRYAHQANLGARKDQVNDRFLDPKLFTETVLRPYRTAFLDHTGPFIFEFQYIKKSDLPFDAFVEKLDAFFAELPGDFSYSVEIRNKDFLKPAYFNVLKKHNVAHVFNHWSYMPPLAEQMKRDAFTADFVVARILTPIGMSYQETQKKFGSFDRIIERQPQMRKDLMRLIEISVRNRKLLYLLINNRIEGSAPETITELLEMLEGRLLK
ncbi:MAG: DUF72 domain-containing protein [Candidatus Zhuqueibacterota bacterium]